MKRIALTVAALLLTASPAWADVITPDQQACENTTKGAACTFNVNEGATNPGPDTVGTCEPSTCYTNEYCDAATDAIQHEPGVCTVPVACLTCQASDGGTSTTSDGGTVTNAGGSNSSGGCDVAPGGGLSSLGALLVAAIVPLVLRRRQRKAS